MCNKTPLLLLLIIGARQTWPDILQPISTAALAVFTLLFRNTDPKQTKSH